MTNLELEHTFEAEPASLATAGETWACRYGQRHRLERMTTFPKGIHAPVQVRIYSRAAHYVLQWWDPAAKKTLYDRVDGDLIDAIARAREIDSRLVNYRSSGHVDRKLGHADLVDQFRADLARRADAGELAPATVSRYGSALDHYMNFVTRTDATATCRYVGHADRNFALRFASFLSGLMISSNGHSNAIHRLMKGQDYVLDVVRAMFEWAADPQRGHLLPSGFSNPFRKTIIARRNVADDIMGEPDITIAMAQAFLMACDDYQLKLFAPMLLWGLRASEPIFMFHEKIRDGWMHLDCVEDLGYLTKGHRNKRLPFIESVAQLLLGTAGEQQSGLVHMRRGVAKGRKVPLLGASLDDLILEYQRRCQRSGAGTSVARAAIRDSIVRDAGGLTYDLIHGEFTSVARHLNWPATATLKDFRHLFNVSMENGGVTERERRYLMGQAQGRAAIVNYTHLNKLAEHYHRAIDFEMSPLIEIIKAKLK